MSTLNSYRRQQQREYDGQSGGVISPRIFVAPSPDDGQRLTENRAALLPEIGREREVEDGSELVR